MIRYPMIHLAAEQRLLFSWQMWKSGRITRKRMGFGPVTIESWKCSCWHPSCSAARNKRKSGSVSVRKFVCLERRALCKFLTIKHRSDRCSSHCVLILHPSFQPLMLKIFLQGCSHNRRRVAQRGSDGTSCRHCLASTGKRAARLVTHPTLGLGHRKSKHKQKHSFPVKPCFPKGNEFPFLPITAQRTTPCCAINCSEGGLNWQYEREHLKQLFPFQIDTLLRKFFDYRPRNNQRSEGHNHASKPPISSPQTGCSFDADSCRSLPEHFVWLFQRTTDTLCSIREFMKTSGKWNSSKQCVEAAKINKHTKAWL